MKLIVMTKDGGPKMREARELAERVMNEGYEVEILEWESDEAVSLAALHDIFSPPAFLIVSGDGRQVGLWQGEELPLASDIKYLM